MALKEQRLWALIAIMILTVGTFAGIYTTRNVGSTNSLARLITDCTQTARTSCGDLVRAQEKTRQKFMQSTIRESVLCLGIASRMTPVSPGSEGELKAHYYDCFNARSPKVP